MSFRAATGPSKGVFVLVFLVLSAVVSGCPGGPGARRRDSGVDGAAAGGDGGGTGGTDAGADGEGCNGLDDDGDGMVDELCACTLGETQPCYLGDASLGGVGECAFGTQRCEDIGTEFGAWSECIGSAPPSAEVCDEADNNCDGTSDEGCSCTPRTTRPCYTGPADTEGVGICAEGAQTCELSADGASSSWGACEGSTLPGSEICNGADDDCDGVVDDGCECVPGATRPCYEGPAGTRGMGICRDGTESCVAGPGGIGSEWGSCSGWVGPMMETCNGIDDDCNGIPDETCTCRSGETRGCYSGSPTTRMIGACRDGTQMCTISGGSAAWGACAGERLPGTESCNMTDDDCDTRVDEGACMIPPTVVCPPPQTTRPLVAVTLTGSAMDADGAIASYAWTVVSAPTGATGTFSAPNSATTLFTPNLVGVYTVQLTVRDNAGLTASCTTTVTATGDGIRVEVSWSTDLSDVDTHLLRMASGSPWFNSPNDCYFANRTPSWDAPGLADDARLDIDDVNGFGPENINVDAPVVSSTYRVGIHYYSAHGAPPTTVTVRIYCGDIATVPVATYTRLLSNGAGLSDANDFWRVADVRWTGADRCTVTPVNTLTTGTVARTTP